MQGPHLCPQQGPRSGQDVAGGGGAMCHWLGTERALPQAFSKLLGAAAWGPGAPGTRGEAGGTKGWGQGQAPGGSRESKGWGRAVAARAGGAGQRWGAVRAVLPVPCSPPEELGGKGRCLPAEPGATGQSLASSGDAGQSGPLPLQEGVSTAGCWGLPPHHEKAQPCHPWRWEPACPAAPPRDTSQSPGASRGCRT